MPDQFTVGVEEEYLTVDAATLELRPRADEVLEAARPTMGTAVQAELTLAQIEVATPICGTLDDVDGALRRVRSDLDRAARTRGSAIAATGTHPDGDWLNQAITPLDRYLELEANYQQLAREQLICGCHVHVGVADPDDAVRIMDRIRSWVPVLLAFGANSPYWQGVDTGYASFRTQIFDRWPTAGPAPVCGDRAGYEQVIQDLVDVGMVPDESYVYWHLRPSGRYPTLELRVADVALHAEDAVTLAALFRSLVRTAHRELRRPTPELPRHEVLRAATWRACRFGIDGHLIDLVDGGEAPAGVVVRRLLDHLAPDLREQGEWEVVAGGVEAVLSRGNGAQRQRAALRAAGSLRGVTRMIVRETVPGEPATNVVGQEPTSGASA